jgi:hypothetical protein
MSMASLSRTRRDRNWWRSWKRLDRVPAWKQSGGPLIFGARVVFGHFGGRSAAQVVGRRVSFAGRRPPRRGGAAGSGWSSESVTDWAHPVSFFFWARAHPVSVTAKPTTFSQTRPGWGIRLVHEFLFWATLSLFPALCSGWLFGKFVRRTYLLWKKRNIREVEHAYLASEILFLYVAFNVWDSCTRQYLFFFLKP